MTHCVSFGAQLMLDSWNESIFRDIKDKLQESAMKLVADERNGEAFDSQLVIGVRESYGKWLITHGDVLMIQVIIDAKMLSM